MALRGTPPHTPGHLFSYIYQQKMVESHQCSLRNSWGENGNQYRVPTRRLPPSKKSPHNPTKKKRFSSQLTMTTCWSWTSKEHCKSNCAGLTDGHKGHHWRPKMLDSEVWAGDLAFLRNQKNVILVEKWLKKHTHTPLDLVSSTTKIKNEGKICQKITWD